MVANYIKLFLLLLSFLFAISCADDVINASVTLPVAFRPDVPIQNGEVRIGKQVWMTKNLNVSRYRNGDPIPQVTNPSQWGTLTTGAWCYYENNTSNGKVYGKLYNWYAVNDPRGLAPTGYHVPTDAEWSLLTDYLGGENMAGAQLKSITGWEDYPTFVNNATGFTALPGGHCLWAQQFGSIGTNGFWWSSTGHDDVDGWIRILFFDQIRIERGYLPKTSGFSVRCVKD